MSAGSHEAMRQRAIREARKLDLEVGAAFRAGRRVLLIDVPFQVESEWRGAHELFACVLELLEGRRRQRAHRDRPEPARADVPTREGGQVAMPIATADQRQLLAQTKERWKNANAAQRRAREIRDAAKAAGDEDAIAVGELAVQQADAEFETANALHVRMLSMVGGASDGGLGGDSFLDNPDMVRTLEALGHTTAPIGSVMLGQWMTAEAFAGSLRPRAQGDSKHAWTGGPARSARRRPPGHPDRPLTLLYLHPLGGVMVGATYEYVQEIGDLDQGAAETAEGATKPEADVDFQEASTPARTIATWRKARRQVLADMSGSCNGPDRTPVLPGSASAREPDPRGRRDSGRTSWAC